MWRKATGNSQSQRHRIEDFLGCPSEGSSNSCSIFAGVSKSELPKLHGPPGRAAQLPTGPTRQTLLLRRCRRLAFERCNQPTCGPNGRRPRGGCVFLKSLHPKHRVLAFWTQTVPVAPWHQHIVRTNCCRLPAFARRWTSLRPNKLRVSFLAADFALPWTTHV